MRIDRGLDVASGSGGRFPWRRCRDFIRRLAPRFHTIAPDHLVRARKHPAFRRRALERWQRWW